MSNTHVTSRHRGIMKFYHIIYRTASMSPLTIYSGHFVRQMDEKNDKCNISLDMCTRAQERKHACNLMIRSDHAAAGPQRSRK